MNNERIDYKHFANKYAYGTGQGPVGNWTKVELKILLDEINRCYEELDKWTNYATYIENVDMDCHKDASAEAGFLWKCTDCGAHFELPENGIYECEFGCDAS